MAHKIHHEDSDKLDTSERRAAMPPGKTLEDLGLTKGDVFIDVGCGTGYFTLPALDIVGADGRVIGLDTSEEMLQKLKASVGAEVNGSLELLQSGEYTLPVDNSTGTFALLSFVLHEVDDPARFLKETMRVLQKGSTLVILDWEKKPSEHGPPLHHRLAGRDAGKIAQEQALSDVKMKAFGTDWYIVSGTVR